MTNEELAAAIKNGNSGLYEVLWRQCYGYIKKNALRWAKAWHNRADFDIDDLIQSGYFALVQAVSGYDSEGGSFISFLKFCLLSEFSKVVGCRTSKVDPLNSAISLDEPIFDGEIILGDTLPIIEAGFEAIEEKDFKEHIALSVREAVSSLSERQKTVIEEHYLSGKTYKEISEKLNISQARAAQIGKEGLKALLHSDYAFALSKYVYGDRNFYSGTGFNSWKSSGSKEEKEAEISEEKAAYFVRYLSVKVK